MKTILLTIFLSAFVLASYGIDASISFASFKNDTQPYVEIYTHILGSSVTFTQLDSTQLQSSVEVLVIFKQAEKIILADKFNLVSPIGTQIVDFVDLKRYALDNGTYELEVQLKDNHQLDNTATYQSGIVIDYSEKTIQQSDIQLVASAGAVRDPQHPFTKNHFHLEPLPYHFYAQRVEKLLFYNEIYALDLGDVLQIRYFVEQLSTVDKKTLKIVHKKRKSKAVMPLLLSIDINDLPSGNYNLVVEIRDTSSDLKSRKSVFFQRSNPIVVEPMEVEIQEEAIEDRFVQSLDAEQLNYSLLALMPILPKNQSEMLNTILKEKNLEIQRNFLYAYWREKNIKYTEAAYQQYMEVVRAVDKTFKSGFRYGFETDRGYAYLKYGRPDDMINVQDDPAAPPYEIWSYNDFPQTNQTNIRFLFYNPSLAGGDYILLHSTALGEINNLQWEVQLYRNAPTEIEGEDYFSATKMRSNNGRRARQLMEDF